MFFTPSPLAGEGRVRGCLEAPFDLELEALVCGLLPGRFLPLPFQADLQSRALPIQAQAGAHPVGPGRAVRQHGPGIGRQQPRVEEGEAVAHLRGQPARRLPPWPGGARPAVVCRDHRPSTPLWAAPHVGDRVRDRPWPRGPGSTRTVPHAPHSS